MRAPSEREQFGPLVRTFVRRFFENDLTDSANDLKQSFFGLIAILGVPAALAPVMMGMNWQIVGHFQGFDALRILSRADKHLYLSYTMIAAAAICALTWNTLLVDRRDALVLGTQPVRARTIVLAKLAALGIYIGALGLTMHTLSAGFWALTLNQGRGATLDTLVRGLTAHLVAGCAATALVVFAVVALQGIMVATFGPRVFERFSALFQVGLVIGLGLAITVVPAGSVGIVRALQRPQAPGSAAILAMPASWLLGLYEVIIGHLTTPYQSGDLLGTLAWRAVMALLGIGAVAVVANAVASHRVLRASLAPSRRFQWKLDFLKAMATRVAGWTPAERAVAGFALTSLSRVERQRLALGVGAGVICALAMSAVPLWQGWSAAPTPPHALLALSMGLMCVWLAAVRIAFSLPADLKAAWIFDVRRPEPLAVRAVTERLLLIVGVGPWVVVSALLVSHWGPGFSTPHAILTAAVGWLVAEVLLGPAGTIPGTQPWRPERAKLRARWPLYLAAFIWTSQGFPLPSPVHNRAVYPEPALLSSPWAVVITVTVIVVAAFAIRHRGRVLALAQALEEETNESVLVTVRLT
jgi:hypothetical protein